MPQKSSSRRRFAVLLALGVLVLGGGYYFWQRNQPPGVGTPLYQTVVKEFYTGLVALQAGDLDRAAKNLTEVTRLVPQEPAAWANLGILQLRQNNFEEAARSLEKARQLAPQNGRIEETLGLLNSRQGNAEQAIMHLRRAIELDSGNLRARYALAQEITRQGGPQSDTQAQALIKEILKVAPNNLAALIENMRYAAKQGDTEELASTLKRVRAISAQWSPEAQQQLQAVETATKANARAAAIPVVFLSNLLKPLPEYQQSLSVLDAAAGELGQPFERFLWLTTPSSQPSPPDMSLAFKAQSLPGISRADALRIAYFAAETPPAVLAADAAQVQRAGASRAGTPALKLKFPGAAGTASSSHSMAILDWNYDFKNDVALAGAGGLRLYQQSSANVFADVTRAAKLAPAVANANYYGAWPSDIEADGDLDLVLAPRAGAPLVLRNNGDGTWQANIPLPGAKNVRGFAWADFDDDGDNDIALLSDAGALQVFSNERSGRFSVRAAPQTPGKILAMVPADVNGDGMIDIVALQADGAISRLTSAQDSDKWDVAQIARLNAAPSTQEVGTARLLVADLDNNGGLDIVASSGGKTHMWLADVGEKWQALATPLDATISSIGDLNDDGRLDLVGVAASGVPQQFINSGSKDYHWQVLRSRAAETTGDQRINSFGIGGTMELRSGLLYEKQIIEAPSTHFGLGERAATDAVRVVWPNGATQGEFDLKGDTSVGAEQRLTGSCPFLWTFDGKGIHFVKDVNWRSPLGLKINAQDTAGVVQTEDWAKIRADQLAPRDGFYDLRVTADLWEAHIFDHIALLAVDHPENSEVWVDERFSIPMPPLRVTVTNTPQPIVRATDDRGQNVTEIVSALDSRYLDTFGKGRYQGVARDHWVEVELPQRVLGSEPLWLIAEGWLHPTDSSINVALGQGKNEAPRDLSLEVADGKGGWIVAQPHLGFPAGKNKAILIDLKNVFRTNAPRKLRLRTNLEIYWDKLSWATAPTGAASAKQTRLLPQTAQLRYRGVSPMAARDRSSPELPAAYDKVQPAQRWRDLVGLYTRFGDVNPLLQRIDDRYVIMNAGDEMHLKFTELPAPPQGWKRDFVFISDGWTKDGNLNTGFSKTLLPLPLHSRPEYSAPLGRLQDDPAYRKNPRDWQTYHTRYVSTRQFRTALRPQSN
ncbi:MAG TPA: FG-GAP-like repeat-containing protein [Abditibacteriaceae bacterium]|jgi:cytochrome c-type biogenesis protein CcmH/NrfG